MLAQMLALMAAAAPAQGAAPAPAPTSTPAAASAPASNTVSPVTVSPSPDKAPSAATINLRAEQMSPWGGDFTAIWPAGAYNAGVDGHVILNCVIDAHGLAESCQVAKETPAGKKLGAAALELRPTFKLKPATDADGQPVSAVMALNVTFTSPKEDFDNEKLMDQIHKRAGRFDFGTLDIPPGGGKLATRGVTIMDNPVWTDAASFDDLAAAYPGAAGGVEGYVAAHCRVERSGDKAGMLRDCQIIKESPAAVGFAKAGLALTAKFRADPAPLARLSSHGEVWVDIQMRLPAPTPGQTERTVTAPRWIVTVDPKVLPQLFPPEARAKGLTDGRGAARCRVAGDGTLTGCVPEDADPDGLGFAEVAARVASKMRMNLWSADGAPVDGGVVHVPIHLSLAETN
ncbi:TonB family protein [Phenylobacterium sp.]|uniref:TonB family protein n=1 Tax=Phenylobacterium sp. TaxID=1871053 RepID=UPI002C594156|nr:TonB family protein [Phenylobacterium sp.]HLZ73438.1 TonB family protein [Phenylobacterium sp.]